MTHQSRLLQQLTSTLLSPLAPPLPEELLDELLPAVDNTLTLLPAIHAPREPALALHTLVTCTAELVQSLSHIGDTLQMNRQTTQTATRRMRAAKDLVGEWRRERDECDRATRWIEQGDWDRRLRDRQCARECSDVLAGFEDVCGAWRERLVATHGSAALEVGAG